MAMFFAFHIVFAVAGMGMPVLMVVAEICLGIFLCGWEKAPPRLHLLSGAGVALGGILSGIFVVTANAWMNSPAGFTLLDGRPVAISPFAAMFTPAWTREALT